ncbi:MAG: glycosyltransferase, partial [Nitrospirota bacterium]
MNFNRRNAVFTIASKNYLAFARTLLKSVKKHHDDIDLFLLLADECEGAFEREKESFIVMEARELDVSEFEKMAFMYSMVELNTAMKPFFINF